ncbi:MAG: transposase [Crocinitomicaceae bacterium]
MYLRGGIVNYLIKASNVLDYNMPERISVSDLKIEKFQRRAAIEPLIGHLKTDYRMGQNYLHGIDSPQINAFLAATGWNLKKMMLQLKIEFLSIFTCFSVNLF